MQYHSKEFHSGYELTQYLNANGIQPDHIISITRTSYIVGYSPTDSILLVYVD